MTSNGRRLERKRELQARTRSARRLLAIAFVCVGLGALGGAVMPALLTLACFGSWALRGTNSEGVGTSRIMGTITTTHT